MAAGFCSAFGARRGAGGERRPAEAVIIRDGPSGRRLASRCRWATCAEAGMARPILLPSAGCCTSCCSRRRRATGRITHLHRDRLAEFREHGARVIAVAADGREIEGCALIGADGVHSRVRSLLIRRRAELFRPQCLARDGACRATMRQTGRTWSISGSARRRIWCITASVRDGPVQCGGGGERRGRRLRPAGARRRSGVGCAILSGWADAPLRMLAAFKDWMVWPLLDAGAARRDGRRGAATLIGDAAHPLMPFLASGAVMAIEDAAVAGGRAGRAPDDPAPPSRL